MVFVLVFVSSNRVLIRERGTVSVPGRSQREKEEKMHVKSAKKEERGESYLYRPADER